MAGWAGRVRRQAAVAHLPHAIALCVPPAVEQLVRVAHAVAPLQGGLAQHLLQRRLEQGRRARRLRRRGGERLARAVALAAPSAALHAALHAEVEAVVPDRLDRAAELDVGAGRVVRARLLGREMPYANERCRTLSSYAASS